MDRRVVEHLIKNFVVFNSGSIEVPYVGKFDFTDIWLSECGYTIQICIQEDYNIYIKTPVFVYKGIRFEYLEDDYYCYVEDEKVLNNFIEKLIKRNIIYDKDIEIESPEKQKQRLKEYYNTLLKDIL